MATQRPLAPLLAESSIILDAEASGVEDAIRQAGALLVLAGAVDESYTEAMLERELSVSTYVGDGVAIPHGTLAEKKSVKADAIVMLRFADPIDWNGNDVHVVVGIAAVDGGHIALLAQLAGVLLTPGRAKALREATTRGDVYRAFATAEQPVA